MLFTADVTSIKKVITKEICGISQRIGKKYELKKLSRMVQNKIHIIQVMIVLLS